MAASLLAGPLFYGRVGCGERVKGPRHGRADGRGPAGDRVGERGSRVEVRG